MKRSLYSALNVYYACDYYYDLLVGDNVLCIIYFTIIVNGLTSNIKGSYNYRF